MRLLVPLYVYPAEDPDAWSRAPFLGDDVTVIINVHDGPGGRYDAAYGYATATLAEAGVPRLGYVDLDYARRPVPDVHADIAAWRRYPVDGYFFDQVPTAANALRGVEEYLAPARGRRVLNPGTRPHPGYRDLADLVCTFEGPWVRYRSMPRDADWPDAAHLVYDVPVDQLDAAVRRLRRRVGCGFVTDLGMPNPYRGLPWPAREPAAR